MEKDQRELQIPFEMGNLQRMVDECKTCIIELRERLSRSVLVENIPKDEKEKVGKMTPKTPLADEMHQVATDIGLVISIIIDITERLEV